MRFICPCCYYKSNPAGGGANEIYTITSIDVEAIHEEWKSMVEDNLIRYKTFCNHKNACGNPKTPYSCSELVLHLMVSTGKMDYKDFGLIQQGDNNTILLDNMASMIEQIKPPTICQCDIFCCRTPRVFFDMVFALLAGFSVLCPFGMMALLIILFPTPPHDFRDGNFHLIINRTYWDSLSWKEQSKISNTPIPCDPEVYTKMYCDSGYYVSYGFMYLLGFILSLAGLGCISYCVKKQVLTCISNLLNGITVSPENISKLLRYGSIANPNKIKSNLALLDTTPAEVLGVSESKEVSVYESKPNYCYRLWGRISSIFVSEQKNQDIYDIENTHESSLQNENRRRCVIS